MPLPFIIGGVAVAAASRAIRGKYEISGAAKMSFAKDKLELAEETQKKALDKFEKNKTSTLQLMESISKEKIQIQASFETFSDIFEKIQNRPEFKAYERENVTIPKFEMEQIRKMSSGAKMVMNGIGNMYDNAMVNGMDLIGFENIEFLESGLMHAFPVFDIALGFFAEKLDDKASEAYDQAKKTQEEVDEICEYLNSLKRYGAKFKKAILLVGAEYGKRLNMLDCIVNREGRTDWNDFSEREKLMTQNTVLLVGLLCKMCQVQLVKKSNDAEKPGTINKDEINKAIKQADEVVENGLLEDVA